MSRPRLLFLSPIMPASTGQGLAMRAGILLEALAADHEVHVLVIPVVGAPGAREQDPTVPGRWCARLAIHPLHDHEDPLFRLIARVNDRRERLAARLAYPKPTLCRFATTRSVQDAVRTFGDVRFHEVHVFRLYLAPFAEPYLQDAAETRPICRLDLDDHESRTRSRLAAQYEADGDPEAAALERFEAERYAAMEARYIPRFDRVYVCSESDRTELTRVHEASRLAVIPNAVRIPATPTTKPPDAPFTLLFVGTLGYYPNQDAALFLGSEVLPRLRARAQQPFRIHIVGPYPSRRVRALAAHPEVQVLGAVADIAAAYRDAHVAVVPVRVGGGTRIKVLEAFSYRRPVVATTVGAEGIDALPGTHFLCADTADAFAAQCLRLMEDVSIGQALVERAFDLVRTRYSSEHVLTLVRRDHGDGEVR